MARTNTKSLLRSKKSTFGFFERDRDYEVIERKLPHWTQPGTLAFITFRTFDSLPRHVIESWKKEQHRLLRQQGIDPHSRDVDIQFKALPWLAQMEINNSLADRWHNDLDSCYGACVLKRQDLAKIVSGSLHKFENDRYELSDFVVMPNHVHLLAAFRNETDMLGQCRSWKHYTAVEINRYLKLKGQRFWQQDGFDHLVRSEHQFRWLRKYIADNPSKAGLQPGEFEYFTTDQ